jgi:DedD protein
MALLSFFKRKENASRDAAADAPDSVQRARTGARQRLIGAVVLLGIGIVGFPLLFETQPRPIPVDIPIDIPRKESAPPLAVPAPRAAAPASRTEPEPITERADEQGKEVAPPPVAEAPPALPAEKPPAPARHETPAAAANEESQRAKALLEGKPAADARFIVQVGAFADANAARDTRAKVEKLGLKTYTQVVETESGKRIRVRVGPFASRDEADKAAGKIKSAGLPSAILTL